MAKKRTRKVRFIVLMEVKGRNGTRSSFSKGSNSVRPGCDAVLYTNTKVARSTAQDLATGT